MDLKKWICLLGIVTLVCSAAAVPTHAEIERIVAVSEGQAEEIAALVKETDAPEYPSDEFFGYRPPAYRPSWLDEEGQQEEVRRRSVLPPKFDLRTQGRLSSVKNQHQNGDCWSFATMAALESFLMPSVYDFSEKHLVDHSGFFDVRSRGGSMHMGLAYLARQEGPVSEESDPYGSFGTVDGLQPTAYVRSAYQVPKSEIKQMIMQYGAVQTAIYSTGLDSKYFNRKTSSQFIDRNWNENHEVVIVGWDDEYPKENFNITPKENGAWIAKNSWGETWGERGYYYISYEDMTIAKDNMVYTDVSSTKWYDQIYQYDEYGRRGTYGYKAAHIKDNWFANVFEKKSGGERLKSVAFYTNEPQIPYEIWIDTNFKGHFGSLRKVYSGMMDHSGYHTVDLPQEEAITGDRFAVAIKIGYRREYPIAIEKNVEWYLYKAAANRGESFISSNGTFWEDLYELEGANVCLKAFTVGGEVAQDPAVEPQELRDAALYGSHYRTADVNKVWRVRFNQPIDSSFLKERVKVWAKDGYREVPTDAIAEGDQIVIRPKIPYQRGEEYYLYIGKVTSKTGRSLRPIKAVFRVD